MAKDWTDIPIIDLRLKPSIVAKALEEACRLQGFFYLVGHGVDTALQNRLEALSREFFRWDEAKKMQIAMAHAGRAWRGYFPVGGELTAGRPDLKEGLYFGSELGPEHPAVKAGLPLHGANLFPQLPDFKETVLDYIEAMTQLGHRVMQGLALSLGLDAGYFDQHYTRDPLVLFRIFHYPADPHPTGDTWGVGEHTDYGLLTMLKQDEVGGLEVKCQSRWVEAPIIPGSFVCNIGDMLDRMTGGLYRSTPHRVKNRSGRSRLSFPFFFDPNFHALVQPIDTSALVPDDAQQRWDRASVHNFQGTYGDYLLGKVGRVFPELGQSVLP